ncbi:hypothetical protein [Roseateles sp.]|uniref:hypothetical protein n=1 Tax=Roseateles sp. TaxID=1971397 RepID=UPI003BAD83B4
MKKIIAIAVFLSSAVTAAFAYPPDFYFCNRACIEFAGPRGSPEYQECMLECMMG